MLLKNQNEASIRTIEDPEDLAEMRLGAVGYIFHGTVPPPEGKRGAVRATTNLLHFARCPKLDRAASDPDTIWFRTIHGAKQHLDEIVGESRWKWCKHCQREITQKLINEK